MDILEYESFDELEDREIRWNQLLSKSLDNNPFLTYEWLTAWWRHYGKGRTIKIFIAKTRKKGKVTLIAPTMYSTYNILGVKLRKLEFIATPASDYHTFLLMNFIESTKVAKPLMEKIVESVTDAECIELKEIPEDSYTSKLLAHLHIKTNSCETNSKVLSRCPYVILPENFETVFQTLGSNMRRNLKRWKKQALRDYKVEFVAYDEIGTVEDAMEIFFELHRKRWKEKNELGSFSNDVSKNFHIEVAEAFAKNGWLALYFLTFNDKPVSALYSYEYNGKLYAYLSGFDPEYATYRPGHLTFEYLIKHSVKRGLNEFDFLRGMEEYKNRWKANVRRNFEFRILKGGLKTKLYNWITNSKSCSYLCKEIGKKVSVCDA